MNGQVREFLRQERSRIVRERSLRPHVEFCIECGGSMDRKGVKVLQTCAACRGDVRPRWELMKALVA